MDTLHCFRAEELAQRLGISRSKAYQLMASGELPVIKIGRLLRVRAVDLDAWLERQAEAAQLDPEGEGDAVTRDGNYVQRETPE